MSILTDNMASLPADQRADFDPMSRWMYQGDSVLDLGCGDGALLASLEDHCQIRGVGIELVDENISQAISRGVNVVQRNLEEGLVGFEDQSFDHVILSRTLQVVRHTEFILQEMLRVGREVVVSFPNFAYWKNRWWLARGFAPVSEDLPHEWHDSPNVRFFSILDFEKLCSQLKIVIKEREILDCYGKKVKHCPNFFGSLAVYRITKS